MITSIGKWNFTGRTLSVAQHLRDTGDVICYLMTKVVSQQVIDASGLSREVFFKISEFCARTHDIGKCTPAFQHKTPKGEINCINYDSTIASYSPHGLAGAAILYSYGVPMSICELIAAHHGTTLNKGKDQNPAKQFERFPANYGIQDGKSSYQQEWDSIYNEAIENTGISAFPSLNIRAQFIITGLIIMADWIASNEEYFPLDETDIQETRSMSAFHKINFAPIWDPEYCDIDDELFYKQFGFLPNVLQQSSVRIASEAGQAGLMIIESTMGTGKTEAALAASEILGYNAHSGGMYFGLPTQATANALLPRVTGWINNIADGKPTSLRLAHGEAFHNSYYKKLSISDSEGITVNKWLSGRHRALLPDFVVGTVDQVLAAGVAQKFIMLLHFGMAGKVVVIDEVHSYDAYMSTYMEIVLSWLGAYNAPVILLSATLTKERRNAFIRAYSGKELSVDAEDYPCITWIGRDTADTYPVNLQMPEKRISIQRISKEEVCSLALKAAACGGCVGVIVNKVKYAQELAKEITTVSTYKTVLLHSRFLPKDRAEKEETIVNLTGKQSSSEQRNGTIIIGTQVLEQSLDIDFDVIYTEICPIDLLLQRIGRLHRHNAHDTMRPDVLMSPKCFVFESEGRQIYDEYIIKRTNEVLPEEISLPEDMRKLIEDVYDLTKGDDGLDKREFINKRNEMHTLAETNGLLKPTGNAQYNNFRAVTKDISSGENVRYGMNTMQVVLLKKCDNRYLTLDGSLISDEPSPGELSLISEQKINLYYQEDISEWLNSQSLPRWAKDFDAQFMFLDKNNTVEIDKSKYRYSKEYGLQEIKKDGDRAEV